MVHVLRHWHALPLGQSSLTGCESERQDLRPQENVLETMSLHEPLRSLSVGWLVRLQQASSSAFDSWLFSSLTLTCFIDIDMLLCSNTPAYSSPSTKKQGCVWQKIECKSMGKINGHQISSMTPGLSNCILYIHISFIRILNCLVVQDGRSSWARLISLRAALPF